MVVVVITAEAYAAVIDDCQGGCPMEACGLIGARRGIVDRAFPVPNVAEAAPRKCGFLTGSRAQLRAMREIEDTGLDLGAIYHSHSHAPPVRSDLRPTSPWPRIPKPST